MKVPCAFLFFILEKNEMCRCTYTVWVPRLVGVSWVEVDVCSTCLGGLKTLVNELVFVHLFAATGADRRESRPKRLVDRSKGWEQRIVPFQLRQSHVTT